MTLDTFFKKFDQFADAPNAVAKMRELVLQLAMQGKIVSQNPKDEKASILLARISKTKELLISERTIRRQETAPIDGIEAPFSIPPSWVWTRLGEIADWGSGSTPSRGNTDLYDGGIAWLKSGELNDNQALAGSEETVTEKALTTGSFRRNKPGDVLLAMYGATIGKVAILAEPAVTNQAVCGCTAFDGVFNRYLFSYLLSQRARFHSASEGGAQPNISKVKIVAFPFPLPPLAEQKRIVAKVDELMALCDRLEAQQQERDEQASALARASLARFAEAPTPANLNLLFHKSYSISPAELRQSILTMAVRGKLVPQDSKEGDVEEIVKDARKQAGLTARSLGELDSKEPPFDAPGSWRWVTVADVAQTRLGKMLDQAKNRGEPHPYLRNTNVHWFRFELDSIKTMPLERKELDEYRLVKGDVLICEGGHGIARSAVWEGQIPGMMFQKALHRVRPLPCLDSYFFTFCLWLYERESILQRYYTGAGIPHFTGKALARVLLPLPPLAEQRRIVTKVNQLMVLVDQLETQLATTRSTAKGLLEALVNELTAQRPPCLQKGNSSPVMSSH